MALAHGVIFVEIFEKPAERAAAGVGGCRNRPVRLIVAARKVRQIVWLSSIGLRDEWAPCGAESLCNFMLIERCFLSEGRADNLRGTY